jgi:hypothetical protein
MADLRIAKLPDRNPVKLTIAVMPDLHDALQDYAKLYAETYGQADAIVDLIPAMLTAFLESDRSFQRSLNDRAKQGK